MVRVLALGILMALLGILTSSFLYLVLNLDDFQLLDRDPNLDRIKGLAQKRVDTNVVV